jgi:hypothetical protein
MLFIWRLWLEKRVAHIIHLEALVGEQRDVCVIHLEALVKENNCPCYSFGDSGWRRELPVLFIWRLWLEKRVARFIHLEALVGG